MWNHIHIPYFLYLWKLAALTSNKQIKTINIKGLQNVFKFVKNANVFRVLKDKTQILVLSNIIQEYFIKFSN